MLNSKSFLPLLATTLTILFFVIPTGIISSVFFYCIIILSLFCVTLLYTPKLKAINDSLYKPRKQTSKIKKPFFTFWKLKKQKDLYIKVLKLGTVATIIFFITFLFNFNDTSSIYYQNKDTINSLEQLESLNPFNDANAFLLIVMYLSFFTKVFSIIISLVTLFDLIFRILIFKAFSYSFKLIKFCFFFLLSKINFKQKRQKS